MRQQFDLHLKDWLRLPLDEISKSMVADRHRAMASTPSGANHVLKYFRTVWNYARRVHDLPESPTMAIEWYDEKPKVHIIEDLRTWRDTVDVLQNPIHKVFCHSWLIVVVLSLNSLAAFKTMNAGLVIRSCALSV